MVKSGRARGMPRGRELHYDLYPDSLASQYMRETDADNDINILINLIRKHRTNFKPKKDELVVHLRVGDVVERSRYTVKQLLEKQRVFRGRRAYVKPLSFYEKSLNEINRQVKKITLVTGGCKAHDFTKSKEYIQAIKSLFEKSGFDVRVRLGNPPDDDFIYMVRSKLFVPSGGGFSQLVQLCHANLWRSPQ